MNKHRNKQGVIIVALDDNNGIGANNDLLYPISEDLKRFKQLTLNHKIVMGRKTFESLPNGPLPKRENIIISRQKSYSPKGATVYASLESFLDDLEDEEPYYIIGGGSIYEQFMDAGLVSRIYATHIHASLEAEIFFPPINSNEWERVEDERITTDIKSAYEYSFTTYDKKGNRK